MAYQEEVDKIKAAILAICADATIEPEVKSAVLNQIKVSVRSTVASIDEEARAARFSIASAHRERVAAIMEMDVSEDVVKGIRDEIASMDLLESDIIPNVVPEAEPVVEPVVDVKPVGE